MNNGMGYEIYNENLSDYLAKLNKKERLNHEVSGKISPTKLVCPTLEAVLQMLGVPQDPPSNQALRYFIRGHLLEKVAVKAIKGKVQKQVECEYKGGVGYIDAFKKVPHEIKSVGNWTFKNAPLKHHELQTAWYGLAMESPYCWLHYINAETFAIKSYKVYPRVYEDEIRIRSKRIEAVFRGRTLCNYEAIEPFHKSERFCNYKLFFNKKGAEAEEILKENYPEIYSKFKKGL